MKTMLLEEALKLANNPKPLSLYKESTFTGAWLVVSPCHPDEEHRNSVRTEGVAVNGQATGDIHEKPEDFTPRHESDAITANAALLAHFYNHGPELVEVLAECLPLLQARQNECRSVGAAKAYIKARSILARASTVQMP